MSWDVGRPQDRWSAAEQFMFFREIYTRIQFGSFTWNPPSVPATSTVDTVITMTDGEQVKGLRVGMPVFVSPPAGIDAGLTWGALVTIDDTLTVRLGNATAGDIDPISGTWAFAGVML